MLRRKSSLPLSLFCVLWWLVAAPPTWAVTVSPLLIEMDSVGRGATARLTVTNTWSYPVPVEIRVSAVDLDEEGNPSTVEAPDDFLVFPPQALIQPGRTQVFRIQYLGDPDLAKSRTYIFGVHQLPIRRAGERSGIQILFNFIVVVSVSPPGSKVDLRIAEARVVSVETEKGTRFRPLLTVANHGNRAGFFAQSRLTLRYRAAAGGPVTWEHAFSVEEMRALVGVGLVQPGHRRRFVLPIDLPGRDGALEAEVVYVGLR